MPVYNYSKVKLNERKTSTQVCTKEFKTQANKWYAVKTGVGEILKTDSWAKHNPGDKKVGTKITADVSGNILSR